MKRPNTFAIALTCALSLQAPAVLAASDLQICYTNAQNRYSGALNWCSNSTVNGSQYNACVQNANNAYQNEVQNCDYWYRR